MPFSDIYISTFKNDIEYNQLLLQAAVALQTNKFIQVSAARRTRLLTTTEIKYEEEKKRYLSLIVDLPSASPGAQE